MSMDEQEWIPAGEAICLWTEQIRQAARHRLYLVALLGALELPSMISGLLADDGRSTGASYIAFLVRYVGCEADYAGRVYGFRCSVSHQGRLLPHKSLLPFAFIEPGAGMKINGHVTLYPSNRTLEAIDVDDFVLALCNMAEGWAMDEGDLPVVQRNLAHFVRRHEEGMPPNIEGVPVIY